jgi:hypothetical protein
MAEPPTFRVLVLNPKTERMEWVDGVDLESASRYANADPFWHLSIAPEPPAPGLIQPLWQRFFED